MKTIRTTIAALAATVALGAGPALAAERETNPNPRAAGAPGQVCKPLKAVSQQAFKECVRTVAKSRGSSSQGNVPNPRAAGAPGQVCKPLKAVSQQAFKECVRTVAKSRGSSRP